MCLSLVCIDLMDSQVLLSLSVHAPMLYSPLSIDELFPSHSEDESLFTNVDSCAYFSVDVLSKIKHSLTALDKSTLQLLAENARVSECCSFWGVNQLTLLFSWQVTSLNPDLSQFFHSASAASCDRVRKASPQPKAWWLRFESACNTYKTSFQYFLCILE